MDNYYKKCSRCNKFKNVQFFYKDSGKETKTCGVCREKCSKNQLEYLERKKQEIDQEEHFKNTITIEIKQRLDELIILLNDLKDVL